MTVKWLLAKSKMQAGKLKCKWMNTKKSSIGCWGWTSLLLKFYFWNAPCKFKMSLTAIRWAYGLLKKLKIAKLSKEKQAPKPKDRWSLSISWMKTASLVLWINIGQWSRRRSRWHASNTSLRMSLLEASNTIENNWLRSRRNCFENLGLMPWKTWISTKLCTKQIMEQS